MSFQYADVHFNFDNFDFILKADDDSYFVMENMRYLLLSLDPDQPSLLGRVFKRAAGSSRSTPLVAPAICCHGERRKVFASKALKSGGTKPKACDLRSSMPPRDVKMGQCLAKLGVRILDTEDRQGLRGFHPLPLQYTLGLTSAPDWLIDYSYQKFRAIALEFLKQPAIHLNLHFLKSRRHVVAAHRSSFQAIPTNSIAARTAMLITTATLNRKIVAFSLGAMLGALATQIVMMATGSREPIEDYHHGNQASAYSLAPDPVNQLSTPTPTEAAPEAIEEIGKVRLLCLIMTHPGNYKTKAIARTTPGPTDLNLTDAYNNLWQKAWMSFDWAERWLNLDQFDFVLKADDDTFVVVENLRLLLAPLDPGQPVHLGRWFFYDRDPKQSYMSGGGGYVLSRAAVRLFLARAVRSASTPKECDLQEHTAEDWKMEKCVSSVAATFHYTDNLYLMEFLLY
uniref:N-acetylgalactosaminide beta-1,3-galactosyltransferase n=1 Tax=Macrostomum lignano TaxID=282301 RepID=A0A1I8FAZ8_9PLAT